MKVTKEITFDSAHMLSNKDIAVRNEFYNLISKE